MKKLLITLFIFLSLCCLAYLSFKDNILNVWIDDKTVKIAYVGKEAPYEKNEIESKRTENSIIISKGQKDENHIFVEQRFYPQPQFINLNGWKYIEYKYEPKVVFELKKKIRTSLLNIAYAVSGNIKFSPTNGDGYVRYKSGATWSTARNALSGNGADRSTSLIYSPYVGKTSGGYFDIYRFYSPFDTSALPDNYTVSSASYCVYVASKSNGDNDGDDWINIFRTYQASYFNLVNDDFNIATKWETSTAGATAIDIGNINANAYNCWTMNATGISWISNTSTTAIGLLEGHDDINSAYAGSNNTSNHIRIYTSETSGTSKDPYLSVDYAPTIEWLNGYDGRIKIFIPSYNVPTSSEGFPYELVLATTSGYSLQEMQWIFNQMNVSSPWLRIQPTTDDGITQMYGEVEDWNTTSKMARIWVSKMGWTPSTTTNLSFYLYFDKNHSTSTYYVSKVSDTGDKGNVNAWKPGYFQSVFNFSNTTTDSINISLPTIVGTETYTTDEKGFENSAFDFDGFTYISPSVLPTPTSSIFMTTFKITTPPPGTYTFFDYHFYYPGDPANTSIRTYYEQGLGTSSICINIGEELGSFDCGDWAADGEWHSMSVHFRPDGVGFVNCVYVDTVEIACESPFSADPGIPAFIIGAEHDGSNPFLGSMGYFWVKGSVEGDDDYWYQSLYKNFNNTLLEYLPNYKMIHY